MPDIPAEKAVDDTAETPSETERSQTQVTPSLPQQNRRVVRLRCNYPVTCSMLGKRFTSQVVDMGLEGLRLEVPLRVERGQLIALRYEGPTTCYDYDTVQARIVWARPHPSGNGTLAGVAYVNPPAYLERSWIRHLLRVFDLDKLSVHDRRRDVRLPISLQATVDSRNVVEQAWVRDLGLGGALVECSRELEVGTHVTIFLVSAEGEHVSFEATVVRTVRGSTSSVWMSGLQFTGPADECREHLGRVLRARAFET